MSTSSRAARTGPVQRFFAPLFGHRSRKEGARPGFPVAPKRRGDHSIRENRAVPILSGQRPNQNGVLLGGTPLQFCHRDADIPGRLYACASQETASIPTAASNSAIAARRWFATSSSFARHDASLWLSPLISGVGRGSRTCNAKQPGEFSNAVTWFKRAIHRLDGIELITGQCPSRIGNRSVVVQKCP